MKKGKEEAIIRPHHKIQLCTTNNGKIKWCSGDILCSYNRSERMMQDSPVKQRSLELEHFTLDH